MLTKLSIYIAALLLMGAIVPANLALAQNNTETASQLLDEAGIKIDQAQEIISPPDETPSIEPVPPIDIPVEEPMVVPEEPVQNVTASDATVVIPIEEPIVIPVNDTTSVPVEADTEVVISGTEEIIVVGNDTQVVLEPIADAIVEEPMVVPTEPTPAPVEEPVVIEEPMVVPEEPAPTPINTSENPVVTVNETTAPALENETVIVIPEDVPVINVSTSPEEVVEIVENATTDIDDAEQVVDATDGNTAAQTELDLAVAKGNLVVFQVQISKADFDQLTEDQVTDLDNAVGALTERIASAI